MKGNIQKISISGRQCSLYLPQEYFISDKRYPIVYINGEEIEEGVLEDLEAHFGVDCEEFILLSIESQNWNEDFTPWSAQALTKKSEPFGGGAADYIKFLANTIKPYMDENYKTKLEPSDTVLIGYSLGGLTALYALYTVGIFGKIGTLSGSLWYDNWVEFMDSHKPINTFARVYMSLGRGEEHSRNQHMAKVGNCTRRAALILENQLEHKENLTLEWNDGGHFTQISERFKKALLWLMKNN